MAFVPAEGTAQVNMIYATPGGTAENIWHVTHVDLSTWSAAQLTTLGNTFLTWEQTNMKPRRTAAIGLTNIHLRDLSTEFGAETDVTGASVGTLAGAALPNNVTIAIKKSTGFAGRGFRGRCYHIGCSEAQQSNDGYNATECAALVTAYTALLTSINGGSNQYLALLHSQENKVKLTPRVGLKILSFTTVDTTLDSQRRRLLGHNIHR